MGLVSERGDELILRAVLQSKDVRLETCAACMLDELGEHLGTGRVDGGYAVHVEDDAASALEERELRLERVYVEGRHERERTFEREDVVLAETTTTRRHARAAEA